MRGLTSATHHLEEKSEDLQNANTPECFDRFFLARGL